jgi:long-chain acyl-CoA synthetase
VPLLWKNFYSKIETAMAEQGWKGEAAKKLASFLENCLGIRARRLIFSSLHKKMGGALRILISGGAALDPSIAKGFREFGILLLQGYGLTESAPIIAVNRDEAFRDGAAGLPLPSVEVKISEDGEILARGPNIMKGYYKNPDATREALEDGWLYTGDLGRIDEDGFLFVLGRKKSVIVTPAGKKIYPEEVEAEILKSPYISECLVWGSQTSTPSEEVEIEAIVVPNFENCSKDDLELENFIRKDVKERCRNLASFKKVTKITVRCEELEKTTTKKVKRFLYTSPDQKHVENQ